MNIPILVINLDRSHDRRQSMIDQFNKLKMEERIHYWFVPAFDSKYITNNTYNAKIGVGYGLGRQFRNAELSIINSHLMAIKFAKMMNFEKVIILEDDVILCKDWFDRLNKLETLLTGNEDYIYLSGYFKYDKQKEEKPILLESGPMVGAYSYLLDSKAYDKVIGFCNSYMTTIDDMIMLMSQLKKLKTFVYMPFMTYHGDNISTLYEEPSVNHPSKNYFKNKLS